MRCGNNDVLADGESDIRSGLDNPDCREMGSNEIDAAIGRCVVDADDLVGRDGLPAQGLEQTMQER
jgi:hypothetical protein